ncbi:MAG TPA: acyltransferase [Planctomycetota bacterium]|nr:acyltransferase [Planctomycetota bacterium]
MTAASPRAHATHERIEALDGVRGIAILLVLVMHSLYIAPLLGIDLGHPLARLAMLGWCGVDVFFVLSGFLITGILVRSKGSPHYFKNFYARRVLRIFPLYYLVIALLLWVLPRPPASPPEQVSYLLYYQNIRFALWPEAVFDPARLITWSLAIEEQFYLVWPALVWCLPRRALAPTCVAVIATAITLRFVLLGQGLSGTHFLLPCRMDALAAGALLAIVPPPGRRLGGLFALLGAAGLIAVAWASGVSVPEAFAQQRWGLLCAVSLGTGLLVLARSSVRCANALSARWLRSFGKYSYCIYLTHFLVIEAVTRYGGALLPGEAGRWLREHVLAELLLVAFTGLCMAASWGVGWLSWQLFEQHFLAMKRFFPSASAAP